MESEKNVESRVRRYGLQSQNGVGYQKSRQILKEEGFVLPESKRNCLFASTGSESMKHWLAKAILSGSKEILTEDSDFDGIREIRRVGFESI
jgi:hypothetical protein